MLRLRAFRPTNDKIVKIQLHPTHPWLVTSDASDHVSVWNWEHRQELKAGGVDERRLVGVKLEKLAEGESEGTRWSSGHPTTATGTATISGVSAKMPDLPELGKQTTNTGNQGREDSEYVRLVISNEPRILEADNLRPQQRRNKSCIWWMKAIILCFATIIILLTFVKWGVPFVFEKN
ncbi:hypothetical protein RJ640_008730 [Escallonia rubra]|uniref:Uncharacterized protein n=1 Tax=Escallonia rubra TaxID=112253 RepID=A0AA88QXG0_9ASTE|nr:hypothetical protein RJ640_008730 [Escallonia rubra]